MTVKANVVVNLEYHELRSPSYLRKFSYKKVSQDSGENLSTELLIVDLFRYFHNYAGSFLNCNRIIEGKEAMYLICYAL